MSQLFQNKYRIPSARAWWWDYSRDGAYFVTICTHSKYPFFSYVDQGKLQLTKEGQVATEIWELIPQQFPFASLGEFVIMPNHMHGIVVINHSILGGKDAIHPVPTSKDSPNRKSANDGQPTTVDPIGGATGLHNPMLHQNLSRIIRWYKGRVTFECRLFNKSFCWQPRFYDHIIRNEASFDRISAYILNNPVKWLEDEYYVPS